MRTLILLLLFMTACLTHAEENAPTNSAHPDSGRGSPRVEHLGRSVDQMIYEFMAEKDIPGLALAIVQAPYIPRVVAYGVSDVKEKRLASTKTVWAIGPISQGFAAVAIMQLVEAGKLSLSDSIGRHLPDLPKRWQGITVLQLLQHSSGLSDYRNVKGFDPDQASTAQTLIASIQNEPLAFPTGTSTQQSATNFLLIAQIVEAISGVSYHDFVKKHQIEKLGLKRTMFSKDLANLKTETLVDGHHKKFLKDRSLIDPTEPATGYSASLVPVPRSGTDVFKGFADLWSTAEDISFWDIGLAGELLISDPANRAKIYKPTTLENGTIVPAMAGWQFPKHKGLMDIQGSVPGFSAFLSRFTDPSELVCVTLLANKDGIDFTNLARQIASAFDPKLQSGVDDRRLLVVESVFDVEETMRRAEAALKAAGVPIFAKFDHSKNADEVALKLPPTQVIVFGAPQVGTGLMQANPAISIELPLRFSVWQDAKGRVWAAAPRIDSLAADYEIRDHPAIPKTQTLLERILKSSTAAY